MKKILFRCDSSNTIGLGHVKRCILLAKRFLLINPKIKIVFVSRNLKGNVNKEIKRNGFSLKVLKTQKTTEFINLVKKFQANLIIIDSYDINYKMEKKIYKTTKAKVFCFDDMYKKHYCDILLNHGIQAKKSSYENIVKKGTKILCGNQYTLLRDEFFRKYNTSIKKNEIAIILGGNDVLNLSLKISKLLLQINKNYKITVITTKVNTHLKALKNFRKIKLLVDVSNIAEVLSSKEFIITASGGTLFEVLALKKKFVNIKVAKNQNSIVKYLEKKNIFTSLYLEDITKKNLEKKLFYIKKQNIYKNLDLKFSKIKLVKKIIKELK